MNNTTVSTTTVNQREAYRLVCGQGRASNWYKQMYYACWQWGGSLSYQGDGVYTVRVGGAQSQRLVNEALRDLKGGYELQAVQA